MWLVLFVCGGAGVGVNENSSVGVIHVDPR